MKTVKRIVFITLSCLVSVCMQAQMVINITNQDETVNAESIDKALFTVQYEMTMLNDTLKPENRKEETMMLTVGKTSSRFFSYSKHMADSLLAEAQANNASQEMMVEIMKQYVPKVTYQLFKNYPSGKVTTLDRLAMSNFRCEEENERPEWEILPDTGTIASYPCQKAVCRFKGREYEAWFTTEIPRGEGPWKLYGLPGLILKAADTRGHYTFECTAIHQAAGEDILFPGKEYEPVKRKDLNKIYERYAMDPVGFITSMAPNVTVKIRTQDGQSMKNPKNMPYNPIETE
ncbi:GLPGLI family protein [Parabacteroides sp. OttesenSCG-928-G06]|nr:GLPGLI family protein [Parabacteroides sp. OttesenSCG-928-K15]MDL2281523.1 GLPGLI family protein [Parabacteroides sp. OttesenSCG-928-G06]